MLFCSPFAHPAVMMRTALIKRLRYDKAWDKAEDYDLWERAAEAGWNMTNVPEVLLLYRQHEAQISTATLVGQQQFAQKIRSRYWKYTFEKMKLNQEWIDPVLKISEPVAAKPNMEIVDAALAELLQRSHGEARDAIFDHVTRLYYRVAADCPGVVSRWSNLNNKYAGRSAFATKAKLWMLRSLRIRQDSRLFFQLRKLYISLIGNT